MSPLGSKMKTAPRVKKSVTHAINDAIIYGNFIQRLGFTSGGFPQDIRLENVDTKEIYRFRVKPTFGM